MVRCSFSPSCRALKWCKCNGICNSANLRPLRDLRLVVPPCAGGHGTKSYGLCLFSRAAGLPGAGDQGAEPGHLCTSDLPISRERAGISRA